MEQYNDAVCRAPGLTVDTYRTLKEQSEWTTLIADETDAMRRFEIESFYFAEITPELVELDDGGRHQFAVRRYELIHESEADAGRFVRNDSDLLVVDRRRIVDERRLLIDLFSAAGVFTEGAGFNREVIVTQQTLENFVRTCQQRRVTIQRLLEIDLRGDVENKAIRQLSQLLRGVGISLSKAGTKKDGEQKIYLYRIGAESLDAMQEVVGRRRDRAGTEDWKRRRSEDAEAERLNQRFHSTIERAIAAWKKKPYKKAPNPIEQVENSLLGD